MLRIGQVEATATQDGKYTDGSVAGGIAATRLRASAFNAMQEELAHIVESAGLALDINDMTQVLKAIQKLTLSRANPFADIKSDGAAAISTALTNLGLGDLVNALIKTNNLSDLPDKGVSRGNLGVPAGADKQMCTAWANWTNNGTSCAIEDSFGVSSVTRVSQGLCTVTFSTPLLNSKYSPYYQPAAGSDTVGGGTTLGKTTSSIQTLSWQGQGLGAGINFQRYDSPQNNIHIFGGRNVLS